jgi:hypothetical protein
MDTRDPDDDDLRTVATRRVKARRELISHVAMYLVTNVALLGIWAATGAGYPWFVWPLLGWGIGVGFHAMNFALGLDRDTVTDTRAIDREIERLRRSH